MTSQSQSILDYLKAGNSLTPLEALRLFGCMRLGARIWDLSKQGYKIKSELQKDNGKHFAKYSLINERRLF